MRIEFTNEAEARTYVEAHGTTNLEATVAGKPVEFAPEVPVVKAQVAFTPKPEIKVEVPKPTYMSPTDKFLSLRGSKFEGLLYNTKAVLGVDFNADDTVLADGAATVVDDLLPIRVIPFQSELLKSVRKIPVTQNSFRVLQMNINENAIEKISTTGYSGQGYEVPTNKVGIGYSAIGNVTHQSLELDTYGGGITVSDALLDDVPSFSAQATTWLQQETDANLERDISAMVVNDPSTLNVGRSGVSGLVETDIWNLLAKFYMQGLVSPAFVGQPSTLSRIYSFRDQFVGRIAEQGGINALGKPLVTLLGFQIIPTMYAPALYAKGDLGLYDMDKILLGVKGTGVRTRVNPHIYMQWLSQWIQVDFRARPASAYTSTITRNGVTYGANVQLNSTTSFSEPRYDERNTDGTLRFDNEINADGTKRFRTT